MTSKTLQQQSRSSYFISPRIQGRILSRCAVFWAIYHVLMLHTLFGFEFLTQQIEIMNGGASLTFGEMYSAFWGKYYPVVLAALLVFPVLTIDVIKMSHRVVGPLVPFTRAVKSLKNGQPVERVKLRKGDLLIEFQQDFNEFLDWMNQHDHVPRSVTKSNVMTDADTAAHPETTLLENVEQLHDLASSEDRVNSKPAIEVPNTSMKNRR